MDIGKALRFPLEDRDWIVKILIGGLLFCIPIIDFFVFGYILNILKKAAREGAYGLPAWEDWGGLFGQGFFVFLIGLIYGLIPGILYVLGGVFIGSSILAGFGFAHGAAPLVGLGILFMALGGIIGFAIALIVPMAMAVYADTGEFGQAFNFGEIFSRIGSNASNYVLAILVYIGLVVVLGLVKTIPVLGVIIDIFGLFYVLVVMSCLFGAVYRGNAAAIPPAPPAA